jgi:hypothetical protein
MADILNSVTKHGNALNSHSESKTCVFFTVDIAGFQYVGVNHSATQNFEPAAVFANIATFSATNRTTYIHFGAGFGKREIRRAQPDLCSFAKQFFCKLQECLFQVGKRHIFIHIQTFNLMKNAVRTCRNGFIPENTPREKSFEWGLCAFHYPDLNARCVCTQQNIGIFFDKKSVLHIAGGCSGGKFNAEKTCQSSSISGPSATVKPNLPKMLIISFFTK